MFLKGHLVLPAVVWRYGTLFCYCCAVDCGVDMYQVGKKKSWRVGLVSALDSYHDGARTCAETHAGPHDLAPLWGLAAASRLCKGP